MTPALAVLLALGATARLTLLVTADDFPPAVYVVERIRLRRFVRVVRRDGYDLTNRTQASLASSVTSDWWLLTLLRCPWCLSMWIGPPVAVAAWAAPTSWWFQIPAIVLTASLAAGASAGVHD